jgi:plasmid maintenance system antidote protein VapI
MHATKVEDSVRLVILGELKSCGLSIHRIARDTGIQVSTLSRLNNGKHGLNSATASILLDYFGYEIKRKG